MIMKAEKSHNLLSATWRPRKADDVIQSTSRGSRIRSEKQGEAGDDVNTGPEV